MKKYHYIVFVQYLTRFNGSEIVRLLVGYEKPITTDDIDALELRFFLDDNLNDRYIKNQKPYISGILKLEETPS